MKKIIIGILIGAIVCVICSVIYIKYFMFVPDKNGMIDTDWENIEFGGYKAIEWEEMIRNFYISRFEYVPNVKCYYNETNNFVAEISTGDDVAEVYEFNPDTLIAIREDRVAIDFINGEFSLFDKVYVDGNLVAEENYTAKSGSTIITFKPDYMNSLAEGKHTLKVTYTDGGDATTTFTIAKVAEENNGTADKAENTTNNPKTSDNIVTFVAMFIVSVLGIAITVKYNKNKVAKKH